MRGLRVSFAAAATGVLLSAGAQRAPAVASDAGNEGYIPTHQPCVVNLKAGRPHGYSFTYVHADEDRGKQSYREYLCTGFQAGAVVKATIRGTFDVEKADVDGNDTGTGAGWISLVMQFQSKGSQPVEYDECFGAESADTCQATANPRVFTVPAGDGWKARGNPWVKGFADETGKAVLRIYVTRARTVASGPVVQHLVSAGAPAATSGKTPPVASVVIEPDKDK